MLRAPSFAVKCALSVVGPASRQEGGARAAVPLVRALVDNSTTAAGSSASAAHVLADKGQQQRRRYVSHGSRSRGWSTSLGEPGPAGDDVRGCSDESSASRQASELSQNGTIMNIRCTERSGTPAAMLTTRLRSMFPKNGNGPWWLAVHLLEKGRQGGIKDVKVYNIVLKMIATSEFITEDKLKEMDRLFEQMTTQDGLAPEVLTYNHLIHGYSQAKKEKDAVRILEEMVARGLTPERKTLSSMIVAHSWGSVEDMRRVTAEMQAKGWQPTRRANSAMIGALRRAGDCAGIVQVSRTMLENGQIIPEAALVLAIRAASNVGDGVFARELLMLHGKAKHRPHEQLYAGVMVALRNGSHHEECLCCWRELVLLDGLGDVALDPRTYDVALSSAVNAERWEEMEAIFDMMQVKEVEPTLSTWRSMVDVRCTKETGDVGRLDRIFGSMDRRGWQPSRAVRLHAAVAYATARDWHKAITWFEPALAQDCKCGPYEMQLLVTSLAGARRYGEMRAVWRRNGGAKDEGLFRPVALMSMAEAARELGDGEWASELRSLTSSGAAGVTRHERQDVTAVPPGERPRKPVKAS
eukprot:g18333.t1